MTESLGDYMLLILEVKNIFYSSLGESSITISYDYILECWFPCLNILWLNLGFYDPTLKSYKLSKNDGLDLSIWLFIWCLSV